MPVQRAPNEVFVFNHLMKCGGVSFAIYLVNQIKPERMELLVFPGKMDAFLKGLRRGDFAKRERLYLYSHFTGSLRELFPDRPVHEITLLREPWARFLSAYQFSQDISYFPAMPVDGFFKGHWHNPLTLSLGDGDLAAAKRRLEQYAFVGLTEEYDKSVLMLSHVFGFQGTRFVHANKSKSERGEIPAGMKERFQELNRDDVALYAFARDLFDRRWKELEPALGGRTLPEATDGAGKAETIKNQIDNFRTEDQPDDSFLFAPYLASDRAAQILFGIFYRLGPTTMLYELLGKGRFEQVRRALANLDAYHRDCPFKHPLMTEMTDYFRHLTPNRLEATIGKVLAALKVDMSKAQEKRMGERIPYGLVGFFDFLDAPMMLKLFASLKKQVDVEAEVNRLLDE